MRLVLINNLLFNQHSLLVLFSDALYLIQRKELRKIFRPQEVPENSDVSRTDIARFFLVAFSYKKKRRGIKIALQIIIN